MQFLYINVFFLILPAAIILSFLILKKNQSYENYFSKNTLKKLLINNKYLSKKTRNIFLLLAFIFMIIALARPVINEKEHKINQETKALVLALDISKSMLASDIYPNRLEFAKRKIQEIINTNKDYEFAIVLFAKSSYILSPLTQDYKSLSEIFKSLDNNLNFNTGTNIYSALELSNKLLKKYKNKNVLIISDGGDNDNFDEEIEFAKENNIKVFNLLIGSKKGSAIKEKDGNYLTNEKGEIVRISINENIKDLSFNTNAAFIKASTNSQDIKALLDEISKIKANEKEEKKHKTYTELFYYPLILSLLFLVLAFYSLPQKKSLVLIFLSFSLFTNEKLKANVFDFQTIKEANEAYEKQEYKNASEAYKKLPKSSEQKYNLANAYYKDKEYKKAENLYKNIKSENRDLKFNSLHNYGNSLVKQNKLQEAIKAYEEALKVKDNKETKENLQMVKDALNKQEKQKEQKNKQDKQNNSQDKKDKEKNKKQKQNNKENKQKDSQNKEKNPKEKQEKKKEQENKEGKNKLIKNEKAISELEEKRWLKKLDNYKTKPLLKRFESEKNYQGEKPW